MSFKSEGYCSTFAFMNLIWIKFKSASNVLLYHRMFIYFW